MANSGTRPLGSTYRIQLNGLGFVSAATAVPYLADLGVETLYVSPITRARRGSAHGYDVIDPTEVDPGLGGAEGLAVLLQVLESHDMRLLIDIVPNHMAATVENTWFADLLRHGRRSRFASYFDVAWESADNLIVVPVLDGTLSDALDADAIRPRRAGRGEYALTYGDVELPLDPAGNEDIIAELAATTGRLDAAGRRQLELVLARQHYRMVDWRDAARLVNYRRFFDINELIGVRQEDASVFAATHSLVFELARDPRVAGFRVDHVDGLRDPATYLSSLRAGLTSAAAPWSGQPVILVEKVLARGESLPRWPVQGTTGYELAAAITGLMLDRHGATEIAAELASATGDDRSFADRALQAKHRALEELFRGSLGVVTRRLRRAIEPPRPPAPDISVAVEELTAHVEAYRTYRRPGTELSKADRHLLAAAATGAKHTLTDAEQDALNRVLDVLRGPIHPGSAVWDGVSSWQQLTAPVAAKGVEDTALYSAGTTLAAVDVGFDPDRPSYSVAELHALQGERATTWPDALTSASTHDSKRSQDVRCRLATLTEIAPRWLDVVGQLERRPGSASGNLPDAADRRYAYETLVGVWPVDGPPDEELARRVGEHVVKAAREAKRHTSWVVIDDAYETALTGFVNNLLADRVARDLIDRVVAEIAPAAVTNSLGSVVLRVAAPGVPDTYQGEDLWQHRMVDPDNRGRLDIAGHRDALSSLGRHASGDLLEKWQDGRVKQAVLRGALHARRAHAELFARGEYLPLTTSGTASSHVIAFARRHGEQIAVAVVPRLTHRLAEAGGFAIGSTVWGDATIELADLVPGDLTDALTGSVVSRRGDRLAVGAVLSELPVALLVGGGV